MCEERPSARGLKCTSLRNRSGKVFEVRTYRACTQWFPKCHPQATSHPVGSAPASGPNLDMLSETLELKLWIGVLKILHMILIPRRNMTPMLHWRIL